MNYELVKSSNKDIDRLVEYKKKTVFEYAKALAREDIDRINNYIIKEIPNLINDYYNIVVNNKIVGCLLLTRKDNANLLDEIYIEKDYRNKKIGTSIIKDILKNNDNVYLWVYKDNKKAISLYKRMGFNICKSTDTRYYMGFKKKCD